MPDDYRDGIAFDGEKFLRLDEAKVPLEDRAHQFGDGIYEVIRIYQGAFFKLEEHMKRFERSAQAISLTLPYEMPKIVELIEKAHELSGLSEAALYIQVSRGAARRDHPFPDAVARLTMTVRPVKTESTSALRHQGQRVKTTEDIRWSWCYIKSLNLLPNVLMKQRALDEGFHDAIFVRDGLVTEGTSSNIAIVRGGTLYTHPANQSILHGITRQVVLELARELCIPVVELAFTVDELKEADEAFTMSTIAEIVPIRQVNETYIRNGNVDEFVVTRLLQKHFEAQHRGILMK
ncbi:aminotransferase class IV [Ferroacidibacillus organovorans]|uniref:D-amino-acid transaminase n=1 Tax=Ferroacidibacillus organovorans TaxID=1765683 RepID=A0A101XQL0_9BACL|nr:aminotransferase class IV [Ferroacidibacillus organovorans]KUO95732.1 hypothetical protein ATW55_05205 [Ferroacidibacillus organovorans]